MAIKIALKQAGSLKGIQALTFTSGVPDQLFVLGQLPEEGWFLGRNKQEPIAPTDTLKSKAVMSQTIVVVVN
jgi:hypothetical protein